MDINLTVSDDVEATSYPWWVVIDTHPINITIWTKTGLSIEKDNSGDDIYAPHWREIAGMIHGPFFSREEGEKFIERERHNLGENPVCYCMSAWKTGGEYVRAHNEARARRMGTL